MVWFNKVSWSEGLFLRPQLFQQQERYLEQQAHLRCEPLGSLFWGFSALAIDPAALEGGSLQLLHARGVWPDGLAFDLPRMGPMPAPLRLEPAHAGQELLLALPACVAQAEDVSFEPEPPAGARYSVFDTELRDVNPFGSGPRSVQLLHMRARVLAAAELPQAWMGLPLARVGAVHADGRAQLDPQRLPVLNVLDADATLMRWLGELHAHIGQRASQLAQRLTDELRMHSGDVADYLLLQLLNGHDSRLGHALHMKRVAPERVYEQLCGLAAEMATYLRPQARRAPALPPATSSTCSITGRSRCCTAPGRRRRRRRVWTAGATSPSRAMSPAWSATRRASPRRLGRRTRAGPVRPSACAARAPRGGCARPCRTTSGSRWASRSSCCSGSTSTPPSAAGWVSTTAAAAWATPRCSASGFPIARGAFASCWGR